MNAVTQSKPRQTAPAGPVTVFTRFSAGTYICSICGGVSSSSTQTGKDAVDKMGRKLWGDEFDRSEFAGPLGTRDQWTLYRRAAA